MFSKFDGNTGRHWSGLPLSVVYPITFKLAQCPNYLTNSVHPGSNNDPAWYRLRSATGTNYSVPHTKYQIWR